MRISGIIIAVFVCALLAGGCQTFINKDGKKFKVYNMAKDRLKASDIDTSRFVRQPFNVADYTDNVAMIGSKHIVEPLEGPDVKALAHTEGTYYLFFCNPTCPGMGPKIHRLDSLAKTGKQILVVSYRRDYAAIHRLLHKTSFEQYPYYTIEAEKYTTTLIIRQMRIIQDACEPCYAQYRDDLLGTVLLLLESGNIAPIMFNDKSDKNILN